MNDFYLVGMGFSIFLFISGKIYHSRYRKTVTNKLYLSDVKLPLNNQNIYLSGNFFPASNKVLTEKLLKIKANVMTQMTSETDILICGKFPDWSLIEKARLRGINVIFIDKASDLFSDSAHTEQNDIYSQQSFTPQVPLGI